MKESLPCLRSSVCNERHEIFERQHGFTQLHHHDSVFLIDTVSLALLWEQLGPFSLTGFAGVLLTIPLTGLSMKGMQRTRGGMMKHTDQRVKVTSEVLTAIKVVSLPQNLEQ